MKWFQRILEAGLVSIILAAILQEIEKPDEERDWHGKVAGFIPYDFRLPTAERIRAAYWNPRDSRIFTPEVFGIGWAINFHALLQGLKITGEPYLSEEEFLMPGSRMKDVLMRAYDAE